MKKITSNTRIKELLDQSTDNITYCLPIVNQEKFAKLIVQECIDQVEVFNARMDAGPMHIVEAIKQHFGVKERTDD